MTAPVRPWRTSPSVWGRATAESGDLATRNRFGGDAIYAVDELAKQHTDWSDVAEADGIEAADPAADEAGTCVVG